jgi:hypothetical protein
VTSNTFTLCEVGERYGVTARTVAAWIASGELHAVNVARRPQSKKPRFRVTQAALDSFELARTPSPSPSRAAGRRKKQPAGVVEFYS